MARRGGSIAAVVVALPLLLAFLVGTGVAVVVNVEIAASADNTLFQDPAGLTSDGSGEHFFVGRSNQNDGNVQMRRGLLSFAAGVAAQVPSTATVQSVSLDLHLSRTKLNSGPRNIELRRSSASWGEVLNQNVQGATDGQGGYAVDGDATWIHRSYDAVQWTAVGGDFSGTASATTAVDGQTVGGSGDMSVTEVYTWSSTGMRNDVNFWLTNPDQDWGWVLIGDEAESATAKRFNSRDNTDQATRPVLRVTFDQAPAASSTVDITEFLIRGGSFRNVTIPVTGGGNAFSATTDFKDKKVWLDITTSEPFQAWYINGGRPGSLALNVGPNLVQIGLAAQDGTWNNYTLTIEREAGPPTDQGDIAYFDRIEDVFHQGLYFDLDAVTAIEGSMSILGTEYQRLRVVGKGPHWREVNGIGGLWINMTESDFRVLYRNQMESPTLFHQHGLTPPFGLDGIPFINAPPIEADREHLYAFPLYPRNIGTHFVHSHYGFQHENGLAFPVIVEGPIPDDFPLSAALEDDTLQEVMVWAEDFCPYSDERENPTCFDSESVFNTLWPGEVPTMVSSPKYRFHLVNEKTRNDPMVVGVKAGTDVRLRVINSASTTNYLFRLTDGEAPVSATLFALDGQLISPFDDSEWWLATAQRMDILVSIPASAAPGSFIAIELLPEEAPGAGLGLGVMLLSVLDAGQEVGEAPTASAGIASYIRSISTATPASPGFMTFDNEKNAQAYHPLLDRPIDRIIDVSLTGINGYRGINGQGMVLPPHGEVPSSQNPNALVVQPGERVCLRIQPKETDSHPMHLHGHTFQVMEVEGSEIIGPVRDVVHTRGTDPVLVCFDADNPGVWGFHCHLDYHMAAGMFTTVEYLASGGAIPDPTPVEAPVAVVGRTTGHKVALAFMIIFLVTTLVAIGAAVWFWRKASHTPSTPGKRVRASTGMSVATVSADANDMFYMESGAQRAAPGVPGSGRPVTEMESLGSIGSDTPLRGSSRTNESDVEEVQRQIDMLKRQTIKNPRNTIERVAQFNRVLEKDGTPRY